MNATRTFVLLLQLAALLLSLAAAEPTADWRQKVDPWVLAKAGAEGEAEFLLVLAQQADVRSAQGSAARKPRAATSTRSCAPWPTPASPPCSPSSSAAAFRTSRFLVVNMIWVRGKLADVEALAARAEVARVAANPAVGLDGPVYEVPSAPPGAGFADPGARRLSGGDLARGGAHRRAQPWAQGVDGAGWWWPAPIPATPGTIRRSRTPTAAGTARRPATPTTGTTRSTRAAGSAAPIRLSPATTPTTAPTPWAPWWATTAPRSRAWPRAPAGWAAAT